MKNNRYLALGLAGILTSCAPQKAVEQRPPASYQSQNESFTQRYKQVSSRLEGARKEGVIEKGDYELYHGIMKDIQTQTIPPADRTAFLSSVDNFISHSYIQRDAKEIYNEMEESRRGMGQVIKQAQQVGGTLEEVRK